MACDLKLAEALTNRERTQALTAMAALLKLDAGKADTEREDVAKVAGAIQVGYVARLDELPIDKRDRAVARTLVEGGLKLAGEDDPLQRTNYCNSLADMLAGEIKQAVQTDDAPRAAQLGEQMNLLLVQGVAANLDLARAAMGADSPREPEIARVGTEVNGMAKKIEDEIGRMPAPNPAMLRTMQAIARGQSEVQRAIAAKGKAKGKGPNTKKK